MYIVNATATKPSNVQWFREVNATNAQKATTLQNFRRNYPGFVSRTSNYNPNLNTYSATTTWTDQSAFLAFNTAKQSLPEYQAMAAYNAANNITVVSS